MSFRNLLILLLLATSSYALSEDFNTKYFSMRLPDKLSLASSAERHLTDSSGGWKKFGISQVTEGYSYFFSLKKSETKFSFPWCSILINFSQRVLQWRIPQLGGDKYEIETVGDLSIFKTHKAVYETSTRSNWIIKTFVQNNVQLKNLSVYMPTEKGGLSFTFIVQNDSFPKYENMVFDMIRSLKISDDIKYRERFIEKIPVINQAYFYLGIGLATFPVNLIGLGGLGIIVIAFIKTKKR